MSPAALGMVMLIFTVGCSETFKQRTAVASVDELKAVMATAIPGDTIRLSNGVWNDAELVIEGTGTAEKPIVITAETPGKVKLTGHSNLKIGGEYLVISGLHFTDGYTLTPEVVSFRIHKDKLAYNCRITNTVVSNYSNPERHDSDYWVGMYGKNNRFDHNALVGKGNKGVTMAVRLNSEESQENNHLIDHNYFGPRENMGANGGETLRIGTSHYSLSTSNTQVIYNYFDRCDGEHEIISNKSCGNLFKGNVFYECVGTLTFRHGNENTVESNAFFGNRKPHTGGIRVINEKQKVINNYSYGLTGHRFRGALVVMNGVPNSPINRYHQVKDAYISNNTFVNCDYVQLCAGSDAERSAIPLSTTISNNLFWNEQKDDVFTVYDDISGITFENNVLSNNIKKIDDQGFNFANAQLTENENGYYELNQGNVQAGITADFKVVSKDQTGPKWYIKPGKKSSFDFGQVKEIKKTDDLFEAVKSSNAGDVLTLETGEYSTEKTIKIFHPLTIKSKDGAVIKFQNSKLFVIENGGSLKLESLKIDGSDAPDYAGNAVISTSKYSMNKNYKLYINQCTFVNLDVNHSFNVLKVYKNTFADSILIENSSFSDVSGTILELDEETDDIGIYNAEFIVLKNNSFENVGKEIASIHRGGSDESTFGPLLYIDNCTFDRIGHHSKNKAGRAMTLHGVQRTEIKNSVFSNVKELNIYHTAGEPITIITNNQLNLDDLEINDDTALVKNNNTTIQTSTGEELVELLSDEK